MVGESYVGKTSILTQYIQGEYFDFNAGSIAVDQKMKVIKIDKQTVKLIIWDTCGQEGFSSLTRQYFRNSDGAILVYDISKRETYNVLQKWVTCLREEAGDIDIMLIGNKSDKVYEREVKTEIAEQFARRNGLLFLEASAKENVNIDKAFTDLVKLIKKKKPTVRGDESTHLLKPELESKENKCC